MTNAPALFDVSTLPPPPKEGSTLWQPTKMMFWYDHIIDDMLAHPDASDGKDIAARLGRSPVTINLVIRSDLFKARYQQRRQAFNEDLNNRIQGKLLKVADAALDHTLTALETKRDAVPLPILTDIADKALTRLGYGVKPAGPSVQVNVQQNGGPQVVAPVSADALRAARQNLQTLESKRLTSPNEAQTVPAVDASFVVVGAGEGSEGAS